MEMEKAFELYPFSVNDVFTDLEYSVDKLLFRFTSPKILFY